MGIDRTTSTVELDQLFNTLDPGTRKNLRDLYAGLNAAYTGQGEHANAGLRYLARSWPPQPACSRSCATTRPSSSGSWSTAAGW